MLYFKIHVKNLTHVQSTFSWHVIVLHSRTISLSYFDFEYILIVFWFFHFTCTCLSLFAEIVLIMCFFYVPVLGFDTFLTKTPVCVYAQYELHYTQPSMSFIFLFFLCLWIIGLNLPSK